MRYFISQYMDTERSGLCAAEQTWKKVPVIPIARCKGEWRRDYKAATFPSCSFLSAR